MTESMSESLARRLSRSGSSGHVKVDEERRLLRELETQVDKLIAEIKRLRAELAERDARLARIADAHATFGHSDWCPSCGREWPCPTYIWATTDRDPAEIMSTPPEIPPEAFEAAIQAARDEARTTEIAVMEDLIEAGVKAAAPYIARAFGGRDT